MLVLKRKEGESLLIGDYIEITVTEASNGSVKLSINAPKSVKILRKELISEVSQLNKESINNLDVIIKKKGG